MRAAVALGLAGLVAGCALPPSSPLPPMRIHYLDVGQGDGTIWELPDGSVVVYDCGPAASSPESNPLVQALEAVGKPAGSHLWALIASHGHLDHIGGCQEVLGRYVVDHIYDEWYRGSDRPRSYQTFQQAAREEHAPLHDLRDDPTFPNDTQVHGGDSIPVPGGVSLQLLWPNDAAPRWDDIAHHSLAVRLQYGAVTFCLKGDVEPAQERAIATANPNLRCTVDLMTNHGSAAGSSTAWLDAVRPAYAPVSFGENPYGHPTSVALCRVQASGAKVYATHRLGNLTFTTDGSRVSVAPDRPEAVDYCAPGADYWSTNADHARPRSRSGSSFGTLGAQTAPIPSPGGAVTWPAHEWVFESGGQ